MRVMSFHLMPYADLDVSMRDEYRSAWVVLPNSYFDPEKGHKLYNRYLDELELAAELGFDGVCINEHHQTAYGLMPSPVVMAAALSRRTKSCRIAILGNAFCLRDNPLTLAEEHAMIDVITGGRLITGFVRGVGSEYFSFGTNPVHSLERHKEANDLVVRAWTETGPFAFEGKHYNIPYVNIWPRPYQQPHPPIWCPSGGSVETIEWAAHPDRKYVYVQTYSPRETVARYLDLYRETAATKYGYEAKSDRIAWCAPVYVAETDEQAVNEAREHIEMMFNVLLPKYSELMFFPPGYMSPDSLKKVLAAKKGNRGGVTIEQLIDRGIIICGSPETVRNAITRAHHEMGFEEFMCMLMFGSMPAHLTEKNIRLFAAEVLPAIRALTEADYRGFEPVGRLAAQ
ncbi:MAG: class flavin-dependent oxidoreductase [Hyphomicrobiales bacterium]|nr:class flavin-dependent oxidoreductase [Hyphomicrobiales bacterium]MDB5595029.1 class flavin-dependent oxidoreductase [Hyphomicrobiales bacterium]